MSGGYRLSGKAVDDLLNVYLEGARRFGIVQADAYHDALEERFRFLADYPEAARLRDELDTPVRAHPYKAHLILYTQDIGGDVVIIRVRHGSEDWISDELE